MRAAKDDVEAAYFALLQARDRLTAVQRLSEYMEAELLRMQRFSAEGDAGQAHLDERLLRVIRHVDQGVDIAFRARRETLLAELDRMPARLAGAEEAVVEAESAHDAARARR